MLFLAVPGGSCTESIKNRRIDCTGNSWDPGTGCTESTRDSDTGCMKL